MQVKPGPQPALSDVTSCLPTPVLGVRDPKQKAGMTGAHPKRSPSSSGGR